MMEIVHSTVADLPFIFHLFDESIEYQEKIGVPVWRNYDQKAIERDIREGNHYKLVIDDQMAIAFSVAYRDKVIWRHHDNNDSIYLHRIVVNPQFKGRRLFGEILTWSLDHIKSKGLLHVRMDTWQVNTRIIEYYKTFGFSVVEDFTTPDSEELPVHNRKLAITLLQYVGSHG